MIPIFIINPNAGKGSAVQKLTSVLAERGIKYHLTEYPGHAGEISREYAVTGCDYTIFSCGGEGTNYEVLNGVVGHPNITLGVFPLGSGNDFIKYFGEKTPFLDLENQLSGNSFPIDLIKIESDCKTYYSLNSCSAGMDAMVCENTVRFKKWPLVSGRAAYILGIVRTLFQKFGTQINFKIDGKELFGLPNLFAVCANAPFYGGGYKCSPDANPADGRLNYSILSTKSKLRTLTILPKYRKGTHTSLAICHHGECEKMEYFAPTPVPFNIDGEVYFFKDVVCSVLPAAIKLHLPQSVLPRFKEVSTNGSKYAHA